MKTLRPLPLIRTLSFVVLHFVAIVVTVNAQNASSCLKPFIDRHVLAGAVTIVASPDKVLSLESVGFADINAHKPMKTDALFWIASQSKPLTASALMMLVDEGKVVLDDPVEKYLPEFKGQMLAVEQDQDHQLLKSSSRPITVRDILSHSSGLPFMSRVEHKIDTYPLAVSVMSYALTPLKTQPGTKYDYSNAGINTAGRIIEVVSGMPYEKFMEQRLFKPLGMRDTTFWPTESQLKRLAKSYKPNAARDDLEETPIDQLTYPLNNRQRGVCPAGGYFSTASDLAQFCRMILNGGTLDGKKYLTAASIREMTSTQTGNLLDKDNGESGYGLGWSTSRKTPMNPDVAVPGGCGHGGAYATHFWIDPEHRLIAIFMVQHAGYPGNDGNKIQPAFAKAALEKYGSTAGIQK